MGSDTKNTLKMNAKIGKKSLHSFRAKTERNSSTYPWEILNEKQTFYCLRKSALRTSNQIQS